MEKSDFMRKMESLWNDSSHLSSIRSLLMANFGSENRNHPVIIYENMSTHQMIIKVIEYLSKEN